MTKTVLVIGGGIIGLATTYKLLRRFPGSRVTVIEKESSVGQHQSSHNSGVLHAGLYYAPGSLKARMAVGGIREMTTFCQEHDIPHEICGKLVVATSQSEVPALRALLSRGQANGLTNLTWLAGEEMREVEPHVNGVAAVHVPEEGIADYPRVCTTLASCIVQLGGRVVTSAGANRLRRNADGWIIETEQGDFEADMIVNCAGLHSDRVARLAGEQPELRIVPFRGEYYTLRDERQFLVRNLIYPVPDSAFPFLGVHFTRMIGGGVEAGPNAVLALAREGYRKSMVSIRDTANALSFPGLWRFLARYPKMSWNEVRRSFSKQLFTHALQRLVPDIVANDLRPGGAGVRAQAMLPNGDLVQDFYFLERADALHLLNAPSPGATASLAIGGEITNRIAARLA